MNKRDSASLSDKSLKRVWAWAEANEGHFLGEAYIRACGGIQETGQSFRLPTKQLYLFLAGAHHSFQARDLIGRAILAHLSLSEIESSGKAAENGIVGQ